MSGQTPEQIEQSFADLDFTQGIRKQIVNKMSDKAIKDGDIEAIETTLKAMDGMDKVSLGRLKLNEKANENKNRQDENAALAQLLIAMSDERSSSGKPEIRHSDVPNQQLPANRRPNYDPAIRDATAGTENTQEFTSRVEAQSN